MPKQNNTRWRFDNREGEIRIEGKELIIELGRAGDCHDSPSADYLYLALTVDDLIACKELVYKLLWDYTPPARAMKSARMGVKRLVGMWEKVKP